MGIGEREGSLEDTVEACLGFLGTKERKDWEGKRKEREEGREGWERRVTEGNGGTWRKEGRKETGERLLRRERVKGRVGMLEKRMEGRNKVEAGRNGNDGRLSWKGRVGKEGKGEKREKVVERS